MKLIDISFKQTTYIGGCYYYIKNTKEHAYSYIWDVHAKMLYVTCWSTCEGRLPYIRRRRGVKLSPAHLTYMLLRYP